MPPVLLRTPEGDTIEADESEVAYLTRRGYTPESAEQGATRTASAAREEYYTTPSAKIVTGLVGAAGVVSGGATDLVARGLGVEDQVRALKEYNPGIATGSEVLAGISGVGAAGLASRAGAAVSRSAEGASVLARIGRATTGAAVEGGIFGAGSGVSELALSSEPLTIENAISTLGSHTLFGTGVGGAAGLVTSGAGAALRRAKSALDDAARVPEATGDLAKLDANGLSAAEKSEINSLRLAEKTEHQTLRTAEKAELDAIEAGRVSQRKELADEISALRREVKDQKHFLTTDGVKLPAIEGKASAAELSALAVKANKQITRLADNPIGLAQNPRLALNALQMQDHAFTSLLNRADELRVVFKADATGARMKALDSIPAALERNRSLQQKLADLGAKPSSSKLDEIFAARDSLAAGSMRSSPRLDDIRAARDVVGGGGAQSMAGQMLGGTAYSAAAGVVGAIPGIGPLIAPFAGAAAAKLVGGGFSKAMSGQAARASKAIGAFLTVGGKIAPAAPVLASKVLSSVAYGDSKRKKDEPKLADSYRARTDEIKRLTQYDQTGRAVMRPEARAKVGSHLAPIRVHDPIAGDRMETVAARRIEYLANLIPRRPDLGTLQTGPDRWQPSDMQMRSFARTVAAVEDPTGVIERLTSGQITPEDADAMKNVYPEMYADVQRRIAMDLPKLRGTLPYQRRLALSIFSGMPVDAAMDPRILSTLQASFTNEPGTEGGTKAPMPSAQFGSVRNQEATPSEERQGSQT